MTWITCPKCNSEEIEYLKTLYPEDFNIKLKNNYHVHIAKCKRCNTLIYCSSDSYECYYEEVTSLEEALKAAEDFFYYFSLKK